jgi:hypothetical protein
MLMSSTDLQNLVIEEFSRRFKEEYIGKPVSGRGGNAFTYEFIIKLIRIASKYDAANKSNIPTQFGGSNLRSNNTSRNFQNFEDSKTPSILQIINTSPDISVGGKKNDLDDKLRHPIMSPSHKFQNKLFNTKTLFKDDYFNRNKTPNNRSIKRDTSNPGEKKVKSKSINSDKTNIAYPLGKTNTKKQFNFSINRWNKDSVKKKQLSTNEAVKNTTASSKNNLVFVLEKSKRKESDGIKNPNKDTRPKSMNTLRTSYNSKL